MTGRDARPTRRDGVLTTAVGDGVLLFDPVRWRAHGLNRSAALVWEGCDGSVPVDGLVTRLLDGPAAGADPTVVATDVAATVADLVEEGLIDLDGAPAGPPDEAGAGPVPGTARHVRASLDRPAPPGLDAVLTGAVEVGPFGAFGTSIVVRCADPDLARWLAGVFAPLARTAAQAGHRARPADHVYGVTGQCADPELDHLVTVDGRVATRIASDAGLATHLVWHANQMLCSTPTDRLLVHAAAVADGDEVVVLPAAMNQGKSTLVAGLVRAGLDYLTDECASMDATGTVDPYPRAISLERGAFGALGELAPEPSDDQERFSPGKWFLDPDRVRPGAARHHPGRLAAFVFPRYAPDQPASLVPIPPLEAATELARNSFNLPELGAAGLELLAALATSVPAWRLSRPDLPSGVDAVRRVLADRQGPAGPTTVAR